MKLLPSLLFASSLFAMPSIAPACDCGKSTQPIAANSQPAGKPAIQKHPLKGVVTDLLPDESALMVKHEEIPGVMKAMTMMLTVDPAVLATVKKRDAITGLLYRDAEGTWRLDDVKVAPPSP